MAEIASTISYERLNLQVPEQTKTILKKLALEHGTDLSGYLNAVVFHPIIQSYNDRHIIKTSIANGAEPRGNGEHQ